MYVDFEVILKQIQVPRSGLHDHSPDPKEPYIHQSSTFTFLLVGVFTASPHMEKLKIH